MNDIGLLLGRLMLAPMFLLGGWGKLQAIGGTTQYFASRGVPVPGLSVYAVIAIELVLPLLMIVGFRARLAALGLALFTLAATYFGHPFWALEGQAATQQLQIALKNLAVAGGLIALAAAGPGRIAVRPDT